LHIRQINYLLHYLDLSKHKKKAHNIAVAYLCVLTKISISNKEVVSFTL